MRLKTVLCMFVLCFFFSSMPVAELAVKYGDVNRDGKVTMTDVSILLQYCQGGRPASSLDLVAADVNGDGKVNILDVTMMKEYVVGRISSFPVEKNNVSQNQSQPNRSNSQSQSRTNASNSQSKPQTNVQTIPSGAVVIKSDGWYRISPLHAPGRALDVGGARMEAGANLQLWDYSGVPQQKFYLENRGNGYYTLQAGHSNLYVDAQGGVPRNGENVHQFTYNGSAAQLWRLIDAGGGAVYIETKMQPGLSFDCANRQGTNGTNVQLWERGNVDWNKWKLTPVDAPPPPTVYPKDGWYRIATAYNNNIGLDIGGARTDSTANVQLWSYTGVPQQKFYLQARGNGYYSIKSGNCDMYVDVAGGNSNNGTNVWQYSYNGTGTQLWKFLDAGNGTVWMESKVKPNLVLDARTNQAGNGGNVQVWTRENVAWHKWKLVPVTPPEIVDEGYGLPIKASQAKWGGKGREAYYHDIPVPAKTPIYAIADGTASYFQAYTVMNNTKYLTSYGCFIRFTSNDQKTKALYAHLSEFKNVSMPISPSMTRRVSGSSGKISCGDVKYKKGDIIGYVGSTGNASGPHLHFELVIDGRRVDPVKYFPRFS